MVLLIIFLVVIFVCFGGIVFLGAPYLPTLKPQIKIALELAELKPGQLILELGCGDGRVLVAAAKQGINSVGYELNPILALIAWLRTMRYRKHAKVILADFWKAKLPEADAVFVFLIEHFMKKLDRKMTKYKDKPVKLVSFAFKIPDKTIDEQKDNVFLYLY